MALITQPPLAAKTSTEEGLGVSEQSTVPTTSSGISLDSTTKTESVENKTNKTLLPKKVLKQSLFVTLHGNYTLSEPFTHQKFLPDVATEVSEITPWLQSQIDVGLFEVVK